MIEKMASRKDTKTQTAFYDVQLLFPVLFLVGIGIVMVYSASSALAIKKFGSGYFFLQKQALFAFAGVIVLVISRHFPYKYYRLLAYPLLGLSLALLAVPAMSYSAECKLLPHFYM